MGHAEQRAAARERAARRQPGARYAEQHRTRARRRRRPERAGRDLERRLSACSGAKATRHRRSTCATPHADETIKVNAAQGNGATEPAPGRADAARTRRRNGRQVHFQSRLQRRARSVLFTDTARLSEESSQEPIGEESPADLYEFELTSGPGEPLRGRLSDLTPDSSAGSADVLNLIPGHQPGRLRSPTSSPTACSRQVRSRGRLPAQPRRRRTPPPPGATCNLYLSEPDPQHPGSAPDALHRAALLPKTPPTGARALSSNLAPSVQNLAAVTASVSPDGRYLAFMSEQSLTGYDNRDASAARQTRRSTSMTAAHRLLLRSPATRTRRRRWRRRLQSTARASSTPTRRRSFGAARRPPGNLAGTLAGRLDPGGLDSTSPTASPRRSISPRYLSTPAALFFDSPDALVPAGHQRQGGRLQYEPEVVGSCCDFSAAASG